MAIEHLGAALEIKEIRERGEVREDVLVGRGAHTSTGSRGSEWLDVGIGAGVDEGMRMGIGDVKGVRPAVQMGSSMLCRQGGRSVGQKSVKRGRTGSGVVRGGSELTIGGGGMTGSAGMGEGGSWGWGAGCGDGH